MQLQHHTFQDKWPLTERDFGILAANISSTSMQNIAMNNLGVNKEKIKNIVEENRTNQEGITVDILIYWRNKNPHDNSREVC